MLRSDGGPTGPRLNLVLRGANDVASQALTARRLSSFVLSALINGAAGVVVAANGKVLFVMAFTVAADKVVALDILADPDRLEKIDLFVLG